MSVNAANGLTIGLKTYPQTLALGDHEIVLTFDDGPLPATTRPILDALKAQCVQATFFLVGRNAAANPQMVKREINEGHTVAHHSMTHPDITLRGLSPNAARDEIENGIKADDMAAYGQTSATPRVPFFRFPGFADTKATLDLLAQKQVAVFGADVWASDWNNMTPQAQLTLLMNRLEAAGRGVVLLHDTRPQTAAMVPDFLRALKAKGFKIVHIVPGSGPTALTPAPAGWQSETEASLKKIMPRLMKAQQRGASAAPVMQIP